MMYCLNLSLEHTCTVAHKLDHNSGLEHGTHKVETWGPPYLFVIESEQTLYVVL